MITLGDVIDLYENIMATWYDYKQLRQRFGRTPVLAEVSVIIQQLSDEIDRIGLAIQSNLPYSKQYQLLPALDQLKADIDLMEDPNNSNLVLKKILINIRNLGERTDELQNYFKVGSAKKRALRNDRDYDKFVSHQAINLQILINNLGMSSGVFRHALRMMITCVAGFIIAKLLPNAHHSYWILLTIIVILKPGFSLTKERNLQRLFGTVAGGLIGLLIIYFVQDRTVLIVFIAVFMLFAYTFLRVNYILTVIFMTPYVIILFSLLGMGFVNIVEERLLDTAIASVLAFMGSYFLFPSWESLKLENYMIKMLRANHDYLQQLVAFISGNPPAVLEYKLVRKDLYVSAANLSAAFQRMQSEPKSKQRNSLEVYEFMVLNHILSSNVASLTAAMMHKKSTAYTKEILSPVKKSISILKQSVLALDGEQALKETSTIAASKAAVAEEKTDAQLIEQVHFIYKVTSDIGKVAQKISTTL